MGDKSLLWGDEENDDIISDVAEQLYRPNHLCRLCGAAFSNALDLVDHRNGTHYGCGGCGEYQLNEEKLLNHKRIVNGRKRKCIADMYF